MKKYNLLTRIFLTSTKPLSILKYIFLMPLMLGGQPSQPLTDCAKKHYVSYWDKKGGPQVNGKKATYQYFEVPFHKIIKLEKKTYKIVHPDYINECKEDTLFFKDKFDLIPLAEQGDKYNIAVVMMYLDGIATGKWWVCPAYAPLY